MSRVAFEEAQDALEKGRLREKELEAELRAERAVSALLRAQQAEREVSGGALGQAEAFYDAAATRQACRQEIEGAKEVVELLAYTFDLEDIVEALVAARARRIVVRACFDAKQAAGASTRRTRGAIQRLEAHGVEIRVVSGKPLQDAYGTTVVQGVGIMHCKCLLADRCFLAGSCNWTTSSQANHEMTVKVRLSEAGFRLVSERMAALFAAGRPFD